MTYLGRAPPPSRGLGSREPRRRRTFPQANTPPHPPPQSLTKVDHAANTGAMRALSLEGYVPPRSPLSMAMSNVFVFASQALTSSRKFAKHNQPPNPDCQLLSSFQSSLLPPHSHAETAMPDHGGNNTGSLSSASSPASARLQSRHRRAPPSSYPTSSASSS